MICNYATLHNDILYKRLSKNCINLQIIFIFGRISTIFRFIFVIQNIFFQKLVQKAEELTFLIKNV